MAAHLLLNGALDWSPAPRNSNQESMMDLDIIALSKLVDDLQKYVETLEETAWYDTRSGYISSDGPYSTSDILQEFIKRAKSLGAI